MRLFKHLILLAALLIPFGLMNAQAKQPLTIIVPFPPGGDTDILARLFALKYSERTGRTTIVENKPGAAGIIGFMQISKSVSDGSVIGLVPSTLTTAPYFNPEAAKYDPKTDFVPIMQLTGHGMFIAVNSDTNVRTVSELVDAIKKGRITAYGTPGIASPQNILGEMFKNATNTDVTHVPFKGNAEVVNALMNNTIQLTFNTSLPLLGLVESGKINLIANAGVRRSNLHPNVPTLEEQGIKGVEFESWLGFVGPKDMDSKIAMELNLAFNDIIKQPDVQDRLRRLAMNPIGSSTASFKDRIAKDSDKFLRISKEVNIRQ